MGKVKLDRTELETRNLILEDNSIKLDNGKSILLYRYGNTIQIKGEDCEISYLKSNATTFVVGTVESAKSLGDIVVEGKVCRSSSRCNRFYNNTASVVCKDTIGRLRCKSELGKRVILHLYGSFNSIVIRDTDCEVYIKGNVGRLVCSKDIVCRGSIGASRSEENTYISK